MDTIEVAAERIDELAQQIRSDEMAQLRKNVGDHSLSWFFRGLADGLAGDEEPEYFDGYQADYLRGYRAGTSQRDS